MSWIRIISADEAEPSLADRLRRVAGPDGQVDNVLQVHSLRPHTLDGHMALYKAVLHHRDNRLPVAWLEVIGVWVSHLNGCAYCVDHHTSGLRRLLRDDARHTAIMTALESGTWAPAFDAREQAMLAYARALTLNPSSMTRVAIDDMRETGIDDGEVLEVNQVVAYFCYVNRVVLGLGVDTGGEVLGLAPRGDDDDWSHG